MYHRTEDWMKFLPDVVTQRPLTEICMPMSHDSASYKLDISNLITTEDTRYLYLSYLLKISKSARRFVESWLLCQEHTIYKQLELGIRVLDLRVAFNGHDFWLVHSLTLLRLSLALEDIRKFIETHPSEVVIIKIKPGWEQRDTMNTETLRLESEIVSILGNHNLISPMRDMPTLAQCQRPGSPRILVIYGDAPTKYTWSEDVIEKIGGLTNDIDELKENIKFNKKIYKMTNIFREISFTLTPTRKDIKKSFFRRLTFKNPATIPSLRKFAEKTNTLLVHQLKHNKQIFSKFSFISMDHITQEAIMSIILLNYWE